MLSKNMHNNQEKMKNRYIQSEAFLQRALASIPLASQTFSKSKTHYPYGASPFFIEKGKGCVVWDMDGNEYIDFVNGLLSISLGYCDPDIDAAVQSQMKNGVSFSLPHRLETEVAEKLIKHIPCAEQVRFGKNGSDATAAAIRLARAYTGRDHVAVCGYHGWQDWYIGSTSRNLGVPKTTQELTHTFSYNDIDSLQTLFDQHPVKIAAVIMEPMNMAYPTGNFLQQVKTVAHQQGALLIFDETITGFRFSLGGAQKFFGVTPDLATFGKGLANGYPLSAVVGRAEIMKLMEDIFFSGTFGGETLSLAAAKAVIHKMETADVLGHIHTLGQQLLDETTTLIKELEVEHLFSVSGHPAWSFLQIKAVAPYSMWELKTLFLQEMLARGILTIGTHNLSYAHSTNEIEHLLAAYHEVFVLMKMVVEQQSLPEHLHCDVLEPVFKVR